MGVGGLGGAVDLALGRLQGAVGDVLAHGAVEDQRLLEQHRDVLAQRAQGEVAQVVAVEADRAGAGS